jgi:pyruvate,orthophosphate dikinase
MAKSVGILTSTGGLASHAAVVARGWNIPAVVGASTVIVDEGSVSIGNRTYREGDVLSIDGGSGEVFGGAVESISTVVPEAATLLAWAEELGIVIGKDTQEAVEVVVAGIDAGGGATGTEDVVRSLTIKGYVTPDMLAPALGVSAEEAAQLLDRLVADGIASEGSGMFKLSDDGKALGAEMLASDRESWGPAAAEAALDGFLALDGRMKIIVTAWQMKEVDGEQQLNDHADADYDASVLAQLAALHADADAWVSPLIAGLPRLSNYAKRLDAAAAAATGGDPLYIASPRVDSYHSIWFELHEDLIRLAGKTREQETAAGRA